MKITSLKLIDQLPGGMSELYSIVAEQAKTIGVNYLVVGAMARDLVLVHGYGSTIERGTRDVDFGIDVPSWDTFFELRNKLLANGFTADPKVLHKLHFKSSDNLPWEIDIVPFGAIENDTSSISWPPDKGMEMCVLGFKEVLSNALQIQITEKPDKVIPVASPAGICLLKLVSWLDRAAGKRTKDAADIQYLIQSYYKIPEIYNALHDEGLMEAQGWDEINASAMKLGQDVAFIMSTSTNAFLEKNLFAIPAKIELLVREMSGRSQAALQKNLEVVQILIQGIRGQEIE